ncbi:hypothetical protein [Mucilaginibacter sp.]|uniref:hypothetical protein n=1 Tax=Mucilaginibacter sp. TaxID=1882438 RepID=UPI003B0035CF
MIFSAIFKPTALFSLKESNSTNKGAKSLLLPSPYSIKMAILNQAITSGGELTKLEIKKSKEFEFIRDTKISFYISIGTNFCVSNSFIKIQEPVREGSGFKPTISFREYVYISDKIEIIFEVLSQQAKIYLQKYLYRINYFGKRGCFFQFIEYSDTPNEANVKTFNVQNGFAGILQEFDDFDEKATFDSVNNFSSTTNKRAKEIMVLPIKSVSSSKSFSHYKVF